jgi:hypothetical protein
LGNFISFSSFREIFKIYSSAEPPQAGINISTLLSCLLILRESGYIFRLDFLSGLGTFKSLAWKMKRPENAASENVLAIESWHIFVIATRITYAKNYLLA